MFLPLDFCLWILNRTCYFRTPFLSCSDYLHDIMQGSSRFCNWISLRCLVPWIHHLPPVCRSTFFRNLFWNDSGFVNVRLLRIFFVVFSHVCVYLFTYILMSRNMIVSNFIYLTFTSQIVLYLLQSTLKLSIYIDAVFTLFYNKTSHHFLNCRLLSHHLWRSVENVCFVYIFMLFSILA